MTRLRQISFDPSSHVGLWTCLGMLRCCTVQQQVKRVNNEVQSISKVPLTFAPRTKLADSGGMVQLSWKAEASMGLPRPRMKKIDISISVHL